MIIQKKSLNMLWMSLAIGGYFFINHAAIADQSKGDLARIAILNFDDKTGTEDYKYMSGSLGDAVDSSMQKNFTYERVNPADVDKIIYNSKQKLIKEKIQGPLNKKTDERLGFLKILAKELKVDIVIFGRYTFDAASQRMSIFTNVYYVAINEVADLPVVANLVDSTIFGATDKAAANIIAEIQKMASQASEKGDSGDKKPGTASQKVTLTKKMAKSYIRFIDNRDGTVTDNFTKFVWQKCSMGQKNDTACHGVKEGNTWEGAMNYCKTLKLGNKTWRLPTSEETETILDIRERPSVKVIFAPYTDTGVNFLGYWTSVLKDQAVKDSWAMMISYQDGSLQEKPQTAIATARCVAGP